MAGTATVKISTSIDDLGNSPPISRQYTVSDVDEVSYGYEALAATTAIAIDVGQVTSLQGVIVRLVSGGTTAATGLDIHLLSTTWASGNGNLILLNGEAVHFRPGSSAALSMKNLNSSAATVEFLVYGEDA